MTITCAHRGDPTHAPESTLAGFQMAAELGVEMVEFDVHLTADGQLVVMHDGSVDRCTDGTGKIADMTLQQVQSLDAGSWFGPEFAGQRVPTFAQAAAALPAPIWLNIHLKTVDQAASLGFEETFVQAFKQANLRGRAHVVHHDLESLNRVRTLFPELALGWLPMCSDGLEYIRRSRSAGFTVLQPGRDMMSAEFCRAAHEAGMTANVFYANTAPDMRQYIEWGVDGILTDDPRLLQEVRGEL